MSKFNKIKGAIDWIRTEHILNKSAGETYDKIAKNSSYDNIINFETRSDALKKLVKDIDFSNKKVLDVACGSGAFINAVIDKNPRKVVGVDISKGMLDLARKRFEQHSNVSFVNSSFMDVIFKANSFKYILLANASRYIPSGKEEVFFNKVKEWLKPEGYFIILSDNAFGTTLVGKLLVSILYRLANRANTNTKTALEWKLEPELKKYFVVEKTRGVGWAWHGKAEHIAYFCRKV